MRLCSVWMSSASGRTPECAWPLPDDRRDRRSSLPVPASASSRSGNLIGDDRARLSRVSASRNWMTTLLPPALSRMPHALVAQLRAHVAGEALGALGEAALMSTCR